MSQEDLAIQLVKILLEPVINAVGGAESPEQIEAERQAMILAQRAIQEAIAKKVLPP